MLQVSYATSSSLFSNTTHYPRFFQLLPTAEELADGFIAVIKELKWKRIAVIAHINSSRGKWLNQVELTY